MLLGKYPLSLFLVVKHAFSSGNGALPNEHHTTNTTTMTMFSFFSQPNRIPGIRSIDIKCSSTILDPQLKAFAYLLLKKISVVLLIHHISAPRKPPIYIYRYIYILIGIYRSKSIKNQQIFYLYHYYYDIVISYYMCHCSQ